MQVLCQSLVELCLCAIFNANHANYGRAKSDSVRCMFLLEIGSEEILLLALFVVFCVNFGHNLDEKGT
jgi:hypothetical protein